VSYSKSFKKSKSFNKSIWFLKVSRPDLLLIVLSFGLSIKKYTLIIEPTAASNKRAYSKILDLSLRLLSIRFIKNRVQRLGLCAGGKFNIPPAEALAGYRIIN
jgi:hypothetical protein